MLKLKPQITCTDRAIPLSRMQFDLLNYLHDNDHIDLYKDHGTDIEVTELNGHFGAYLYIRVAEGVKKQLPKFLKWVEKVSTNPIYVQGVKDGVNQTEHKYHTPDQLDFDGEKDEDKDYVENYDKQFMESVIYHKGFQAGMNYGWSDTILVPWEDVRKKLGKNPNLI